MTNRSVRHATFTIERVFGADARIVFNYTMEAEPYFAMYPQEDG